MRASLTDGLFVGTSRTGVPLQSTAAPRCGLPARLADGLGLVSAPIRWFGPEPLAASRPQWVPRSRAERRAIRLHEGLLCTAEPLRQGGALRGAVSAAIVKRGSRLRRSFRATPRAALLEQTMSDPDVRFDEDQALARLLRFLSVEGTTGNEKAIAAEVVSALVEAGVPRR